MMTNTGNHLTQGQFSFLPALTDQQISAQIKYALNHNWAIGIEYTDDPHPRNTYWEMFGNPMFDLKDPAGILLEINNCRKTFPNHYSIVTGLYAESHGIVGNHFFDPEFNEEYSLGNRNAVSDGKWYGGEPIWITAKKQGRRTACFFWPGSEADIQGMRPDV